MKPSTVFGLGFRTLLRKEVMRFWKVGSDGRVAGEQKLELLDRLIGETRLGQDPRGDLRGLDLSVSTPAGRRGDPRSPDRSFDL